MKMLMKEWKLCMHPTGYIMLFCTALILVPGYPYGVSCFYMGLAIYFICLTARENHDASYTLTLPVSRADAVRARILFCGVLEVADLLLMGVFAAIAVAVSCYGKQRSWLSILLFAFAGMLLFMMIPMMTPLDATILHVVLCGAGAAMFGFGLGTVSNMLLSKRDLA